MRPLAAQTGPLSILACALLLVPGGFSIREPLPGVVASVLMVAVIAIVSGPAVLHWRRLVPGLLAVASVTWSNWLLAADRDFAPALVAGLSVGYFALPGVVLVSYIDASALGDHLAQRLRLPARPVLAAVAALQRLDVVESEWVALARARRIRGLGAGRNPLARIAEVSALTFSLLVESLRQAQVLTAAMEARGYARLGEPGARRTWAEPALWTRADTALVLVGLGLAVLPTVVAKLAS